jgi:hypothetical protein
MTIEDLLDRRVPLAIALALCLQGGGAVWWAAGRDADMRFQQRRIDRLEQSTTDNRTSETDILERLARIEERTMAASASLDRIEKRLERAQP